MITDDILSTKSVLPMWGLNGHIYKVYTHTLSQTYVASHLHLHGPIYGHLFVFGHSCEASSDVMYSDFQKTNPRNNDDIFLCVDSYDAQPPCYGWWRQETISSPKATPAGSLLRENYFPAEKLMDSVLFHNDDGCRSAQQSLVLNQLLQGVIVGTE
jgi:hypothetical protein